MNFKKIELEDFEKLKSYLDNQRYRICDFEFATIYMWRDLFETEYAIEDEVLWLKFRHIKEGKTAFSYPLFLSEPSEEGHLKAIDKMIQYTKKALESEGGNLIIGNAPEEQIELLKANFEGIELSASRDWADYLYRYEDIELLAGRKYSSKRNHIKNFDRNYPNNKIEIITKENLSEAVAFYEELEGSKAMFATNETAMPADTGIELQDDQIQEDLMSEMEDQETLNVLRHIPDLPGVGMMLKVGEKVCGLTFGSKAGDTLIVHIEKANTEYKGVYAKLFHEFAILNKDEKTKYINREEDLGEEGLRKSKLSYHPTRLLDKYIVTFPRG